MRWFNCKKRIAVYISVDENSQNKMVSDTTSYEAEINMLGLSERLPVKFSLMEKLEGFRTVAFRILLIDDKIGKKETSSHEFRSLNELNGDNTFEIVECPKCNVCPINGDKQCKLCTIKEILKYPNKDDDKKNDYHYWNQVGIKTFYCPTVIKDFIEVPTIEKEISVYPDKPRSEDEEQKKRDEVWKQYKEDHSKVLNIRCHFAPQTDDRNNLNVQIVGVRDVRTALLLMSRYKFDMIFCDYLLDKKAGKSEERDYIKQLFDFLSQDYKDEIKELRMKESKTDDEKKKLNRLEVLEQLRHDVLDNRGPLGKFWIMPVTGFNQTFIQDLHRSGINLIDYRWNISNGADPITTPWQFLYHLNKFIELQLRSCVYTMEQLLTFLLYTCQDLNTIEENGTVEFDDFQSFMGSEYATLVRLYGNKFPIKRDAVTKDDGKGNKDKSVFATYVWKNFYANQERKYVNEIELYRLMHRFYHRASVMYEDQRGKKLLNDAFSSLWFFLHSNYKVRKTIKNDETLKELYHNDNGKGLSKLKEIVEKCTADKKRDKDKE